MPEIKDGRYEGGTKTITLLVGENIPSILLDHAGESISKRMTIILESELSDQRFTMTPEMAQKILDAREKFELEAMNILETS
ncbi:MAG TPA: hypothetical protein VJJ22_04060 [Candidatus Paceibacterota bacterium]